MLFPAERQPSAHQAGLDLPGACVLLLHAAQPLCSSAELRRDFPPCPGSAPKCLPCARGSPDAGAVSWRPPPSGLVLWLTLGPERAPFAHHLLRRAALAEQGGHEAAGASQGPEPCPPPAGHGGAEKCIFHQEEVKSVF